MWSNDAVRRILVPPQLFRNLAVAAVACALIAVSQSGNVYWFFQGVRPRTWLFALALILPTWLLMAACAPVVAWLARSYAFSPDRRWHSAAIHVVSAVLFGLVHNLAVAVNYLALADGPRTIERFVSVFRVSVKYLFYQDVLAYGVLLAVYLAFHYADMRAQLANARLTALRAQLNPHFFFNTLNAVSTLALNGRRHDVAEVVGRLGDLLRTALDGRAQEVRLARELAFIDDYLAIQRIRFGDRFLVDRRIDPETLDAVVPSLILQPIVENAVEHGVAESDGPTLVSIAASRRGGELVVEVSDTGPGFANGVGREGIGLANTRARLEEQFGTRCRLEYGNLPGGGATVSLSIPFRANPAAAPGEAAVPGYTIAAAERQAGRV